MTKLLTIYIPTFNRPKQLLRTLDGLLPQLNDKVQVVIRDNFSRPPVEQSLEPEYLSRVTVVRNACNVGANENILRGFETAQTPWLWTLSDDDLISATAIKDILQTIADYASHHDIAVLKFGDELSFVREFMMTSIDQLPNSIGNLIFMSSSVYNVENCKEAAMVAHQYSYSMAPSLMVVLIAVLNGKKAVFLEIMIAKWLRPPKDHEWSFLGFSNAILTLFEYPFKPRDRKLLYKKIIPITYSLKRMYFIELQHAGNRSLEAKDTRLLLQCIYAKRAIFGPVSEKIGIALIQLVTSISFVNMILYRLIKPFVRDAHQVQYDRISRG